MANNTIQNRIQEYTKEYYKDLETKFDDVKEDCALFHPLIGDMYKKGKSIMFYGRATNGWEQQNDISFILGYMVSPFFRFMKYICNQYYKLQEDSDDWVKYVGYSNVAKVAPKDGGNPDGEWWDRQYPELVQILKAELTETSPKVAIFATGNTAGEDWHAPLCHDGGIYENRMVKFGECIWREYKTIGGNSKVCTATAYKVDGTLVIITDRPELGNMQKHVDTIMNFINAFLKQEG